MARPAALSAQVCAPSEDTTFRSTSWVEPYAPGVVTAYAIRLVRDLGYDSVAIDSGTLVSIRALTLRWPRTPQVTEWRQLPFPGARVRLTIEPAETWTRISAAVRLLCPPAFAPPGTWPPETDVAAFVGAHTLNDLVNPLSSHFQDARGEVPGHTCAPLLESDRKTDMCRRFARQRPDDLDAQLQYALALIRYFAGPDPREHSRRLREQVQRVRALAGGRCSPYVELGEALLRRGLPIDALVFSERGAELCPDSGAAHVLLGLAMVANDRRRDAQNPLERAIELGVADPDVYREAALAQVEAGDFAQARAHFERAIALYRASLAEHPRRAATWASMGQCAAQLGRYAEAVPYFERARLLNPTLVEGDPYFAGAYQRSLAEAGPRAPAPLPSPR
jgi:hypothetical protein